MCGRYTLYHSPEEIAARFAVEELLVLPEAPRFNIAPSQPLPVITSNGSRTLDAMKWGLVPFWAKDPSIGNRMINARVETLKQKFKHALERRRCLIPADGFYEWKKTEWKKTGQQRQPMHIALRNRELFAFAGLWEEWRPPEGEPLRTCTIITRPPNDLLSSIHDRMPAILRRQDEDAWLDPDTKEADGLLDLLDAYPAEEMLAAEVSTMVNSPNFDAPECIESIAEESHQAALPLD